MYTSVSYFLLLSQDLFQAAGTFNQDEKSTSKDIFLQAMRLLPGFATYSLPFGTAIEVRIGEKEKSEVYSIMNQLDDVVCTGDFYAITKSRPVSVSIKIDQLKIK